MRNKNLKVGVISVGRSENLGDAIISKSLELSLYQISNKIDINFFDLDSGEYSVEDTINSNTTSKISTFKKRTYYPRAIYNVMQVLSNSDFKAKLKQFVADKDVILIGGGHLLIDNYCYFSSKLYLVTNICKKLKVNYEIWCVGVSQAHSLISKTLLKSALDNKIVHTRDTNSSLNLESIFKGRVHTKSLMDPAIFIDKTNIAGNKVKYDVAIGIMDPGEMIRHSNILIGRDEFSEKYVKLINGLCEKNKKVLIFTNGNKNDFIFAKDYIFQKLSHHKNITFSKKPKSYHDIIHSLSSSNVIFAQRLHALLPALVLNNCVIGLKWDSKLESIFSDLGVSELLLEANFSYEDVLERIDSLSQCKVNNNIETFKVGYLECLREVLNG